MAHDSFCKASFAIIAKSWCKIVSVAISMAEIFIVKIIGLGLVMHESCVASIFVSLQ